MNEFTVLPTARWNRLVVDEFCVKVIVRWSAGTVWIYPSCVSNYQLYLPTLFGFRKGRNLISLLLLVYFESLFIAAYMTHEEIEYRICFSSICYVIELLGSYWWRAEVRKGISSALNCSARSVPGGLWFDCLQSILSAIQKPIPLRSWQFWSGQTTSGCCMEPGNESLCSVFPLQVIIKSKQSGFCPSA